MVWLFYCLAFPFVYFEMYALVNAREIIEESEKASKIVSDMKARGRFDGRDLDPNYLMAYVFDFAYMVWSAVGLLSSQWVFFVFLFFLTFLSSVTRERVMKEAGVNDVVRFDRTNSIFSILTLVLIVCNKFFSWFDVPRSILEVLGVW